MAIVAKPSRLTIDLSGPAGNAFALLGFAAKYGKELGLDWRMIQKEMQTSDYEHLVQTFDKHFGEYIDLAR